MGVLNECYRQPRPDAVEFQRLTLCNVDQYLHLFSFARDSRGIDPLTILRGAKRNNLIVLAGVGWGTSVKAFEQVIHQYDLPIGPKNVECVEPDREAINDLIKIGRPHNYFPVTMEGYFQKFIDGKSSSQKILAVLGLNVPGLEVVVETGKVMGAYPEIFAPDAFALFLTSQDNYDLFFPDDFGDYLDWAYNSPGPFPRVVFGKTDQDRQRSQYIFVL